MENKFSDSRFKSSWFYYLVQHIIKLLQLEKKYINSIIDVPIADEAKDSSSQRKVE